MDATARQEQTVEFLKNSYVGPVGGKAEVLHSRPDRTYLVGTLYPASDPLIWDFDTIAGPDEAVDPGDTEDPTIETSNSWKPSSASLSFIHDGEALDCTISFGTYEDEAKDGGADSHSWRRTQHGPFIFSLSETKSYWDAPGSPAYEVQVSSRWRPLGGRWLVTLSVSNVRIGRDEKDATKTEDAIYQIGCTVASQNGSILPYESTDELNLNEEEEELALRYRDKEIFAVGHGIAVEWTSPIDGPVTVRMEPLPSYTVPVLTARKSDDKVFNLESLARVEENPAPVIQGLRSFVDDYEFWITGQDNKTTDLEDRHLNAANRLLDRQGKAVNRMRESIALLADSPDVQRAFSLSMVAMRDQMIQSRQVQSRESEGESAEALEPRWRPFQLGFILLCLKSLIEETHDDHKLVDLIWFPTGGGKTEAYLGLAAIEIFWRRITRKHKGAGTAVVTRYTLRLLTTQQFQRAAALVCAMELLRRDDDRVIGMARFSIGLWVGNDTTPGTEAEALTQFKETRTKQNPDNPFQLESCPWCGHRIMPAQKSPRDSDYGVNVDAGSVILRCPSADCPFRAELPVEVIDERIYRNPPTILLATVDKFARLAAVPAAGVLLGRGAYDAPSLIIQDELHLLSGPLGTTVGIFDAAVMGIIESSGKSPKIVASTATIRAAQDQVKNLMAREVQLFPPSGVDEDDSYFAIPDKNRPGRVYLGLMPQAFTQATSTVRGLTPLLEAPYALTTTDRQDLDAYWTVVAYHNSLRELGRTVTIVRDDIQSLLKARSSPISPGRALRSDGLAELTGQVPADELPKSLSRLAIPYDRSDAIDVVASTNMLSVGIDVPRLASMFMNGQPKTTSEYIQATSRVGRGEVPGIIVTLYRAGKPRDRSHYESFRAYHQALYRHVEPTSVTPWSLSSRRRTLASVLVAFIRQATNLQANEAAAEFRRDYAPVKRAVASIMEVVSKADSSEAEETALMLSRLTQEWELRATADSHGTEELHYQDKQAPSLTKSFGEEKVGWPIINSMRNVDRAVRITVAGEKEAQ